MKHMTLSDTIEKELADRIISQSSLPCELKLQPLASYFGCSTRPVRVALARLHKRGLLSPRKTATLRIDAPAQAAGHITAESSNAAAPLLALPAQLGELTRQLIEQSLHADGQAVFLRESNVATQLGVSTTVVREHFNRLVGFGLLEHVPRRGWRLRPVRQKDLDDFIHVRLSLESLALSIAWKKLDPAIIQTFLDHNQPARKRTATRPPAAARTDNGFHRYIIEVADNFYIRDFFDRQGRFFQLLFEWEDQSPDTTAQTVRQHRRILKHILQNDQPKALAALKAHILGNHPVLTTILNKACAPR